MARKPRFTFPGVHSTSYRGGIIANPQHAIFWIVILVMRESIQN